MAPARHKRLCSTKVLGQLLRIRTVVAHGLLEQRQIITFLFCNVLLEDGPEVLEFRDIVRASCIGVLKVFEEFLDLVIYS